VSYWQNRSAFSQRAPDGTQPSLPAASIQSIGDRVLGFRDRLLGNPAFHRWAGKTPFVRGIARREARAAFDLCAGFVYSQILYACVSLGVFDALKQGPQDIEWLAKRISLPVDRTRRLLLAAVSLRLLEKRGGDRFGLGMLGAAMAGNPGVAKMIEHHHMFYDDLRDPVALLRGGGAATRLSTYWPYATQDVPGTLEDKDIAGYTRLMAASQTLVASEILDAHPIAGHRCLMDVGGGDGTFLAAAAKRAPNLSLMLFDLPAVAARAKSRLEGEGFAARTNVFGGSFRADPLPRGADIISLVRIVHDHNDDVVMNLFSAIHEALPAGGTLLVAEPMSGSRGAKPVGDAYFGFYLMAMGSGRPRTVKEIMSMMTAAGFKGARAVKTGMPLQASVVIAQS
jgi:demethylspheroidene O-methyltransferase